MRRISLRTAMVAIAVLAVILGVGVGLRRRARRLFGMAIQYAREAERLESLWEKSSSRQEEDKFMEQMHWHDAVATYYFIAADRPWLPFDPSPQRVTCECGYHVARKMKPASR